MDKYETSVTDEMNKNMKKKRRRSSFDERHSDESDGDLDELTRLTIAHCDVADAGIHRDKNFIKNDNNLAPEIYEIKDRFANGDSGDNDRNKFEEPQPSDLGSCRKFLMLDKCSKGLRYIFKPCLREENTPLPTSYCGKVKYALLCPPTGLLALFLLYLSLLILAWLVLWAILQKLAEPGGHIFALFVLWISAVLFGKVAELCKLPPLLGMLIMGFILKNVPHINVADDLDSKWSSSLRSIALVIILIRAGLGLDPGALRRLSCVCVRLAFLPCLFECFTVAVVSHFLLDFPWTWGIMLGFVLAAVSPAVVVPSLLSLQERKFGVLKGIPTLVIASASIDDVLAIGGFGVVLGITFSTGNLLMSILQGPIEVLIGLLYGLIVGLLLWFLPEPTTPSVECYRTATTFLSGLFGVFGSRMLDVAGSGPLACLLLSFIAAIRWRKEATDSLETVSKHFAFLWQIFQPFLFALIGAEVSIKSLQLNTVGLGLGTLLCGLVIRIIVSFVAVLGVGFTSAERLFIAISWLPKATVQAAIGPIALDYARARNYPDEIISYGNQIVTLAVLAIMLTAPLGAAAIALSGPKLLSCDAPKELGDRSNEGIQL